MLEFMRRMPEVLGSDLGIERDYIGRDFRGFPQSFQVNVGIVDPIRPLPFPSIFFPFIIH
jgi:hypothetical protein